MQYVETMITIAVVSFVLFFVHEHERGLNLAMHLEVSARESAMFYSDAFFPLISDCNLSNEITICKKGIRSWIVINDLKGNQ